MKSKFGTDGGHTSRETTGATLQSGLSESAKITESQSALAHDSVGPDQKPKGVVKSSVPGVNRPGSFRFC